MSIAVSRRRPALPDPAGPEAVAAALLAWFPAAARDLPWRRTLDPYAIWISEIMLQQTQVRTVIPYWERWMRELPTVASLAEAEGDAVLRLWEGLGYYSRARNLQKAALEIMAVHGGKLPRDAAALLELRGIGRYTAGAIGSIAFDLPAPILDGNVIRVLARVHALSGDPRAGRTNQRLWELAAEVVAAASLRPKSRSLSGTPLVFAGNCSVANQALMELGATLCAATSPDCPACPLATACRAFATGNPARFPEIPARAPTVARRFATVLWTHRGRWLVRKRPSTGHNPDLWELPNLEIGADADPGGALARWLGVPKAMLTSAGKLKRTVTNNRIVEELFRLRGSPRPDLPAGELRWTTNSELHGLPMVARHRALTES